MFEYYDPGRERLISFFVPLDTGTCLLAFYVATYLDYELRKVEGMPIT